MVHKSSYLGLMERTKESSQLKRCKTKVLCVGWLVCVCSEIASSERWTYVCEMLDWASTAKKSAASNQIIRWNWIVITFILILTIAWSSLCLVQGLRWLCYDVLLKIELSAVRVFMCKVSRSLQMNVAHVQPEQEWFTDLTALRNLLPLSRVLEYTP